MTSKIQFFDPKAEADAKRRRVQGEVLLKRGDQPLKNEMVSGIVVKRSPLESIANAANKYMGQYEVEQADKAMADVTAQRQQMIGEALSSPDLKGAISILAQDPATSDAAIEMYGKSLMGNINAPAPMRIADKMYKLQETAMNPNATPEERRAAESQYNLLGQAAKTYNFDRGIAYNLSGDMPQMPAMQPQQPQQMPQVQPQAPQQMPQGQNIPNQDFIQMPPKPNGAIMEPQPNPAAFNKMAQEYDAMLAQDTLQNNISPNALPIDGAQPAVNLQPQSAAPSQPVFTPQAIPGYGEAAATIAGQKKAAETTAASNAKYMEEGRQFLPKQQRALEGVELKAENIKRLTSDVRGLADRSFTTGFTGSIADAVPGTAAYDLRSNLETLRANSAFNALQEMRVNSPTGGALGAVSEKELGLLEAAFTNLLQSQSKDQFLRNLDAFEKQNDASVKSMRTAYEQDYKRFGGAGDSVLPPPSAPNTDGDIAKLRAAGFPEERIQAFIKSRGM